MALTNLHIPFELKRNYSIWSVLFVVRVYIKTKIIGINEYHKLMFEVVQAFGLGNRVVDGYNKMKKISK